MLTASSRLGPYEVIAPLGAGGMGEVYRARDTRLGRDVAIKVLPELYAGNPDRQARFEREAKAVAALSHPNILAIHDYGTDGNVTYAVMELLEGQTLRGRLAKGTVPWREAVEIGAAIAEGLAAAHAKGIIHRDLKPENLFLTADGRVKILDFGLARMTPIPNAQLDTSPYVADGTDAGAVMGTVGYISPEQVRGERADVRSDLFSFGCVLYEMVTGKRAFVRKTAAETMTAILHDEPPELADSDPQIPAALSRLIHHCLAKNPNQRVQSARDLALSLRSTASDPGLHRPPSANRRFSFIIGMVAASLLIGGIGTAAYLLTQNGNRSEIGNPPEETKAIEAVAVLPFENVGDDPKTEHLGEGIPDTIIHGLSRLRLRDLKVQSLTAVGRYKGRKPDLGEIRRDLSVGAVVVGRLQQREDSLSVSVSLIDVRDGSELWGKQYDGKLNDILALQDEIAKDIAANLRLHLTGEEERRLTKRDTEKPEAYQLYLQGRYFWNKRTAEGMKKGIDYFRRAIEIDRTYALAYAGLADSYYLLALYGFVPPREAMPQAKESALKALEIDDKLPEAHATLGAISHRYDWNWAEAERRYKRAIELNPNYSTAHFWYAIYLAERKRFDSAKAESQRAQELDPLSPMASTMLGWSFYIARQYDPSIEQYKKALEIDPYFWVAHHYLARAYFQKRMYEEAIAELQKANTLSPSTPWVIAELGYAQAVSGNRKEAQAALDDLNNLAKGRYVPAFLFALVYSGLGEKDRAFAWMEKAYENRCLVFAFLEIEPMLDGLRSDPRVKQLMSRVGLVDKAGDRD
ncbi:MAG: protein kinase domain-containing protein [Gemmataceae bacterium]